ncbi:hypothetical protein LS73_008125 [Helicobacter muridarum]|uniref:Periplasmic protein n=1 Tax=Helicobacter muridarum TaxID=216 RepID=A0A099TX51_9HELI|nr:hypothetical protein [Helicobacter muridarum]TLD98911.1 hypothetical protein LS73_008125 [Helicobacter muridarum]STQ87121.1 Uncharacterised protein [Helicobacter muridarum]
MLNNIIKKGFIAGFVSLSMMSFAVADDVRVDVEVEDSQSYSGSNDNMPRNQKSREEGIDVARELTITKAAPYSYYKLPQLPTYQPKPLIEEAKGIAVVNGVPLNCKLLGEAEGIDSSDGRSAPSFELIREGALNDLRNGTMDLVDARDRIVLTPVKEAMTCELRASEDQFEEKDCTQWTQIPSNGKILFYRIHANVYDCGAR